MHVLDALLMTALLPPHKITLKLLVSTSFCTACVAISFAER